jgi:secreted trypsin-like serine protease
MLLLFLVACQESRNSFTLNQNMIPDSIVGGLEVGNDDNDSKLVVLIRGEKAIARGQKSYVFCTGSFIASTIVVTAAHCFKSEGYSYQVVYKTQNSSRLSRDEFSDVKNIIVHENYRNGILNRDGYGDDIALIEIMGQKPEAYKLLRMLPDFESYGPFRFLAIGYGQTSGAAMKVKNGGGAGVLHKTSLKAFGLNPFRSTFMVDQTHGSGICLGDSGGPAIIQQDSQNFIIGIVQSVFVDSGSNQDLQGDQEQDICQGRAYFMNLGYYFDWINRHLDILLKKNKGPIR